MTRTKLKEIGMEERKRYVGTVDEFGTRKGFKGLIDTILLINIKLEGSEEIITDHLWFDLGKQFSDLNLQKGDIIAFLDADIPNYMDNIVHKLVEPIINKDIDFVKATFKREGGRITELVAKPLLNILFPDIYKFSQPLSGMIAGKKEIFNQIALEKDYGVDIGILLDVIKLNASIVEVNVGEIKNVSKDWKLLSDMAEEVMRAIIKRSSLKC